MWARPDQEEPPGQTQDSSSGSASPSWGASGKDTSGSWWRWCQVLPVSRLYIWTWWCHGPWKSHRPVSCLNIHVNINVPDCLRGCDADLTHNKGKLEYTRDGASKHHTDSETFSTGYCIALDYITQMFLFGHPSATWCLLWWSQEDFLLIPGLKGCAITALFIKHNIINLIFLKGLHGMRHHRSSDHPFDNSKTVRTATVRGSFFNMMIE